MTAYLNVTQMVDIGTEYDFNDNSGIYIGGSVNAGYTLLWFDGETREEQIEAINKLIAHLEALKSAPKYSENAA